MRSLVNNRSTTVRKLGTLTANFSKGSVRTEFYQGRKYLVAPATLIVPGVLSGSKGPLYYPPKEVSRNVAAWNEMPIVVNHPERDGTPLSAQDPNVKDWVWENQGVGFLRNARFAGKLVAETWFDVDRTNKVDNRIIKNLLAGKPVELSTGLFTDNTPTRGSWNGKEYTYIARNYQPDHLAVFTDKIGACSIADGCGVLMNERGRTLEQILNGGPGSGPRKSIGTIQGANAELMKKGHQIVGVAPYDLPNKTAYYHVRTPDGTVKKMSSKDIQDFIRNDSSTYGDGRWVTLDGGNHVFIRDGAIIAGPKHLVHPQAAKLRAKGGKIPPKPSHMQDLKAKLADKAGRRARIDRSKGQLADAKKKFANDAAKVGQPDPSKVTSSHVSAVQVKKTTGKNKLGSTKDIDMRAKVGTDAWKKLHTAKIQKLSAWRRAHDSEVGTHEELSNYAKGVLHLKSSSDMTTKQLTTYIHSRESMAKQQAVATAGRAGGVAPSNSPPTKTKMTPTSHPSRGAGQPSTPGGVGADGHTAHKKVRHASRGIARVAGVAGRLLGGKQKQPVDEEYDPSNSAFEERQQMVDQNKPSNNERTLEQILNDGAGNVPAVGAGAGNAPASAFDKGKPKKGKEEDVTGGVKTYETNQQGLWRRLWNYIRNYSPDQERGGDGKFSGGGGSMFRDKGHREASYASLEADEATVGTPFEDDKDRYEASKQAKTPADHEALAKEHDQVASQHEIYARGLEDKQAARKHTIAAGLHRAASQAQSAQVDQLRNKGTTNMKRHVIKNDNPDVDDEDNDLEGANDQDDADVLAESARKGFAKLYPELVTDPEFDDHTIHDANTGAGSTTNEWSDAARAASVEARKHSVSAANLSQKTDHPYQTGATLGARANSVQSHAEAASDHFAGAVHHQNANAYEEDDRNSPHLAAADAHQQAGEAHLRAAVQMLSHKPTDNARNEYANEFLSLVGDIPMKSLTTNEKETVVDFLITNCNCWEEEDRQVLNKFSDEKLVKLAQNTKTLIDNAKDDASNADVSGSGTASANDEDEQYGEGQPSSIDAIFSKSAKGYKFTKGVKDDDASEATGNEARELAKLPKSIREDLAFARNAKQAAKQKLIKQITANAANTFTAKQLADKDIPELQQLAKLAGNGQGRNRLEDMGEENMEVFNTLHPNYSGAAGGGMPVMNSKEAGEDLLIAPTLNFAAEAEAKTEKVNGKTPVMQ